MVKKLLTLLLSTSTSYPHDNIVEHRIQSRALNRAQAEAEEIQAQRMAVAQRMKVFNTCLQMIADIAFNDQMIGSTKRCWSKPGKESRMSYKQQKRKQAYDNMERNFDAIREKSTDPLA